MQHIQSIFLNVCESCVYLPWKRLNRLIKVISPKGKHWNWISVLYIWWCLPWEFAVVSSTTLSDWCLKTSITFASFNFWLGKNRRIFTKMLKKIPFFCRTLFVWIAYVFISTLGDFHILNFNLKPLNFWTTFQLILYWFSYDCERLPLVFFLSLKRKIESRLLLRIKPSWKDIKTNDSGLFVKKIIISEP